ncbi:efflux transporter outer membrane subunit [Paraburkholderia sp. FT54]|uniref:efflux transporter outer membrane subunit n=1 Tax=Paraburkholderia sp. FT54 TaxID=3074437 RepID=UPI0028777020|nr:efflux transporter outer membrane subunit [Paraburkholderia sp. FT54]WNC93535.1 efflux transporter outer membrane subunit [Paraburkholderia sp. FT54]
MLLGPLAGCSLAPPYTPPKMALPASYKGTGPFALAHPEAQLMQGDWWTMFGDQQLDHLEASLNAANPNLQAAEETYTQARDIVGEARSQLFPQLSAQTYGSQNRQSEHRLFRANGGGLSEEGTLGYGAALSWEPDFWGEIRNRTNYAKANAQATAAMVASARLSLEIELADDYMALRGLDSEHAVYTKTLAYYGDALKITKLRFAGKIAAGLDVERAQNQLSSAQAADTDIQAQRGVLEHAIAVLAGENPSIFSLPAEELTSLAVPTIPAGVPSALLQRRPDIAQSERQMAAENAAIGVARAAFYPNIQLSANAGFQNDTFGGLASLSNSLWSVGASAVLPLFEGGLRRAEEQQSKSAFTQAADNYRATVLQAFREVEDQLVLTNSLVSENTQQQDSLKAARKVQDLALRLYTNGLDNYLSVTVAQVATLSAELATVQVQTRQLQAAVGMIGAVGGGWSTADLPTSKQTIPFNPLALHHAPGDVREPD